MIYCTCQLGTHLREFIKDYLLIHFDFGKRETIPIKPYPACPKQGIIFYVRGAVISGNPAIGAAEKRAQTVIFGQPVTRQNLYYIAVSVRFQPGALFRLLRIPMTEFLHENVDAELIFGWEIRDVNDQLANTQSYDHMLTIIEAFLWKKFQHIKAQMHPMDKIGQLILENPQHLVKDFKAFSGGTPNRLLQEDVNSPEQYLGLNPNFKYE